MRSNFILMNQCAKKLFGVSGSDRLIGQPYDSINCPAVAFADVFRQQDSKVIRSQKSLRMIAYYCYANGGYRLLYGEKTPLQSDDFSGTVNHFLEVPVTDKNRYQVFNWTVFHNYIDTDTPGFKGYQQLYLKSNVLPGGLFIAEITHNLQQVMQHHTHKKYILYASHDVVLLSTLGYLVGHTPSQFEGNLPLHGDPKFASDFSFRLYRSKLNRYTLKVLFRNGYQLTQPEVLIYSGDVKTFVKRYYQPNLLKKLKGIRRYDYL